MTGEFPAQRASNAENVSIWWRFHDEISSWSANSGLILGLHPANKKRRYKVTPSLIGWAQA